MKLFLLLALMAGAVVAADIETYCRHSLEDQCLNKWAIIDSVVSNDMNVLVYYRSGDGQCDTGYFEQVYFIDWSPDADGAYWHTIKKGALKRRVTKPCPEFEYK
jgi:hypothetical protein